MDVTILRILDASLSAPPGGRVTYLAEVGGAQAGGLPLSGWPGVLEPHPLRLPGAQLPTLLALWPDSDERSRAAIDAAFGAPADSVRTTEAKAQVSGTATGFLEKS